MYPWTPEPCACISLKNCCLLLQASARVLVNGKLNTGWMHLDEWEPWALKPSPLLCACSPSSSSHDAGDQGSGKARPGF